LDISDRHHYFQKQWPEVESLTSGRKNVVNTLINQPPKKFYLPPFHIRFGLIKIFKAMDQNSAGFMCLKNNFPRISDAKIKEGVFVGPQIR
jgi:hypothetical protein